MLFQIVCKMYNNIIVRTQSAGCTYELKSGRISGVSAQHCRIIFIASGGAAPFDTDGRINGGGFFNFDTISSAESDSIQYGSPLTTTSCIIIPNEYTSPNCVPHLLVPFEFRSNSGDVHNISEEKQKGDETFVSITSIPI